MDDLLPAPLRLSASSIALYLNCPRKYAFRYIERQLPDFESAAFAFGKAIHSALEWVHLERFEGRVPQVDEAVRIFRADLSAFLEGTIRFAAKESSDSLRTKGEALVRLYLDTFPSDAIAATEMSFEERLVDTTTGEVLPEVLVGRMDLLLVGDELVELKTSSRRYDDETLRRNVQLSAYAYAFRRRYGRDPKITLRVLLKTAKPTIQVVQAERSAEDDTAFVALTREVIHGITSRVFPPAPSWACKHCEYASLCPVGRPSATAAHDAHVAVIDAVP